MELKEQIYRGYCLTTSNIINAGHDIIPSTSISKWFNISLYKARKIIKELIKEGLLEAGTEGGYDDYACQIYCVRGYRLTNKGRSTTIYKQAKWKNAKIMAKVYGGSCI